MYTVAQDTILLGCFEAGIASKFAHYPVIFHSGLGITSLITFFSYSENCAIKSKQKALLTPSRLPVLL